MAPALLLFLSFLLSPVLASTQDSLFGKVYKGRTDTILAGVSVYNKMNRKTVITDAQGAYRIAAREGDLVIFSYAELTRDTVKVASYMLLASYDASLDLEGVVLQGVKVTSGYSGDSLARRQYYQDIYKKQPGITGFNRPADGFGVTLSPVSFFSRESKQKRRLKKRLQQQEEDAFVDYLFPQTMVSRLTGLSGDSLSLFMYRYRPSYSFCRKASRQDMIVYISDKLREFRRPDE